MNREPVNPDDPQLTAYALGELSASEAAMFQQRLEMSPLAQRELAAMSDISNMLSQGLEAEWKQGMPAEVEVNLDDPKYTAYALGELTDLERSEVEADLRSSAEARRDMESMSEVMSMLSVGLKHEWQSKSEFSTPQLQVLPLSHEEEALEENVIPVSFVERRRARLGVAAAAVAMVGAAFTFFSTQKPAEVANWGEVGEDAAVFASVDEGNSHSDLMVVASAGGVQVPRLLMAEEVEDISQLDLVAGAPFGVDASYLDSKDVIPVGERVNMRVVPAGYAPSSVNRVNNFFDSPETKGAKLLGHAASPFSSRSGVGVLSFSPEMTRIEDSIDREVRLAAEFQGIQIELEQIAGGLPKGSQERGQLEALLERNSRALNALKHQFSQ